MSNEASGLGSQTGRGPSRHRFGSRQAPAALVVINPQNDFLSPDGAGWPFFGEGVTAERRRCRPRAALPSG